MIFRRHTGEHITKTFLNLSGCHRLFRPWTETVVRKGSVKWYLNATIKRMDYRFYNSRGENLEHWLRENARGSYAFDVYPDRKGEVLDPTNCDIRVRFTDPKMAVMFKLQMG